MKTIKIILSRKGFDSSAGGNASPIFKDKLISLPIPQSGSKVFYKDLTFDEEYDYLRLLGDLGNNSITEAHLDPDLRKSITRNRVNGWRPIFGQDDTSQTILRKANVAAGDIFLFYGWFREVSLADNKFKYKRLAPNVHSVFGYLQIEEIVRVNKDTIPACALRHPHVVLREEHASNNTLYIARENLTYDDSKPGAAFFKYNRKLVLTCENQKNRSLWRLPSIFEGELPNFKGKTEIVNRDKDSITLKFIGRNQQELYISSQPQIIEWAKEMINSCEIFE